MTFDLLLSSFLLHLAAFRHRTAIRERRLS